MNRQDEPGSQQDQQQLAAKNHRVFTLSSEIAGLPSTVFLVGVMVSASLAFTSSFIIGALIALAYFPAMYSIHRDDPKAIEFWIGAFIQRDYLGGPGKCFHLIAMPDDGDPFALSDLNISKEKFYKKKTISCFLIGLAYFPVNAYAGYQINQISFGLFGNVGAFLQQVVDFPQDTAGPTTIIVSLVVAIGLWVLAPRFGDGAAGHGRRDCVVRYRLPHDPIRRLVIAPMLNSSGLASQLHQEYGRYRPYFVTKEHFQTETLASKPISRGGAIRVTPGAWIRSATVPGGVNKILILLR